MTRPVRNERAATIEEYRVDKVANADFLLLFIFLEVLSDAYQCANKSAERTEEERGYDEWIYSYGVVRFF